MCAVLPLAIEFTAACTVVNCPLPSLATVIVCVIPDGQSAEIVAVRRESAPDLAGERGGLRRIAGMAAHQVLADARHQLARRLVVHLRQQRVHVRFRLRVLAGPQASLQADASRRGVPLGLAGKAALVAVEKGEGRRVVRGLLAHRHERA
jgi:hypothetical protein